MVYLLNTLDAGFLRLNRLDNMAEMEAAYTRPYFCNKAKEEKATQVTG